MVSDRHGLYTDDFTLYAQMMKEVGITVSVSPGGPSFNLENATLIASQGLAEQYRVTNDMWDCWDSMGRGYPTCVKDKLTVLQQYYAVIGLNGSFPDADMLPLGQVFHLNATSGGVPHGPASWTHLSHDEQSTLLTLVASTRAPMMFGGLLPIDTSQVEGQWTLTLLTNPEMLAVQNSSVGNMPVPTMSGAETYAWIAVPDAAAQPPPTSALGGVYLSLFNAQDTAAPVAVDLTKIPPVQQPTASRCVRDLWARAVSNDVSISIQGLLSSPSIPPHGAMMLWIGPPGSIGSATDCNW
jgi:hypothetical protein